MDTKLFLVLFLLGFLCPYSVFSRTDSSEEYGEENKFRPNYGLEILWVDQGQVASSYKSVAEPAGYENTKSGSTFLCRAYQSKTWLPGKLIGTSCYIATNGAELKFKQFQVPSVPANKKMRWISLNENEEERELPRNVIVGGSFFDAPAYVCRGFLGRILGTVVIVPGAYHPVENTCYLGHNGAQVAWKGDAEILVLEDKITAANPAVPKVQEAPKVETN